MSDFWYTNDAAMPAQTPKSTFFGDTSLDDTSLDDDEISSSGVHQDALDVHWNANQPMLPPSTGSNDDMSHQLDFDLGFMSSSMAPLSQPTVSAFFIDRAGQILAVEQQVSINSCA